MIDPGEALLAVVGLDRAWAGERKVTARDIKRARALPDAIVAEFTAFFRDRAVSGKRNVPPVVDWSDTRDQLVEDQPPEWLNDIPGTGADAVAMACQRARDWLLLTFPGRRIERLTGTVSVPGGASDAYRFRRAWAVANDPVRSAVQDMRSGCLSADSSLAFVSMFPTLHEFCAQTAFRLMIDESTDKPDWDLSTKQQRQLMSLLRISALTPEVRAQLAENFASEDRAPSRKSGPAPDMAKDSQTPTQRIANK